MSRYDFNRFDMGRHPSATDLALFSRGDLKLTARGRIALHLQHCTNCREQTAGFREAGAVLRESTRRAEEHGLEEAFDWSRLDREMTGNINVGVAAANCVGPAGSKIWEGWRAAALITVFSLLCLAGWIIHFPPTGDGHNWLSLRSGLHAVDPRALSLQSTPRGVSVQANGASLTILHPASSGFANSFATPTAIGARYVDEETGQVTITNVYGE